jgi:nucleoside-diphosphate-sugar epimerase
MGVVCFPSLGGSGVVASDLAVGLADRGHDVHLIATALPGRAARHANITFHEVTVPDYPLFEHAPYTLALASRLVEVVRQQRLELLHVHYAVPHATSAYLARQILGR